MNPTTTSNLQTLIQSQKAEILAIAARHGAYNIRLFGSVARNQDHDNSDIDFLVDYDPTQRSPWFPMGLIHDLETLLNRKVDIATPAMLKDHIRDHVLQEAIPL